MTTSRTKQRIAFLGGGAHTIPSYRALLRGISNYCSLRVYSEFYLDTSSHSEPYKLKSVPNIRVYRRIRETLFGLMVLVDHLRYGFDIIHAHSTYPSGFAGAILSRLFGIPLVVSLDAAEGVGLQDIGFGDQLYKRRTSANKYVLRTASIITTLTEFHRDLTASSISMDRSIRIIPRGVDIDRFTLSQTFTQNSIRFLNVGYLHPVKDQATLLRTFALISKAIDCTLTQVGQDYTNGQMQALSKELGLDDKIQFVGFVPHEEILSYYHQADVLLHTSRYESAALVVTEALACGLLVCGTHVGLMADLAGKCCATAPVGDHVALAETVLTLLKDKQRISLFHNNGRKWAEEFDLAWTTKEYLDVYQQLTNEKS